MREGENKKKKGKQADCMRQMADNVAGTRGLGNVSRDFDGYYHRDLLREKKESEKEEKRERGAKVRRVLSCCAMGCAVDAGASLAK